MLVDRRIDTSLSLGLAFVGGYGDAAGFVLAKAFTGHVTGNLVLAAISMIGDDWRICFRRLFAVSLFLTGILLSLSLERFFGRRLFEFPLATAMGAEVILIAFAYFALTSHLSARLEVFVSCMSLALGLQNGAFRRTGSISVHTTYLTGLITDLITTEAEKNDSRARGREVSSPDPKARLLCSIWFAFVLGAAAGAAMVLRFKALGIFGAALLLFVLMIRQWASAEPFAAASVPE
jgi:uncharacterized membrane protein YoaK (UPF0700 family)